MALDIDGHHYEYFSIAALNDPRVNKLPYSIRILLECAIRNCDEFNIKRNKDSLIIFW